MFPVGNDHPGLGEGPEAVDVEAFVGDAGVERFDVAVAPRLSGRDEVQPNLAAGPVGHSGTGQLRAVVAPQHRRIGAALGGQAVQLGDQMLTGDAAVDHSAEAFAGVLVDDRDDLDRPAIGGDIELEVHCPHAIGCIRHERRRRGRGAVAFASSPLGDPQSFIVPKPLDLLVIDGPALGAGIVVGGAKSAARMVFGVLAQPNPQWGVWIIRCPAAGS
jgi:hypothetical protein